MNFNEIREKLYTRKEIRDYFLDKEYGKMSGFKFVYRKAKDGLCSFISGGNIKRSKTWIVLSGIMSGLLISALSYFEISNDVAYTIVGIPLTFSLSFIIFIMNDQDCCSEEFMEKYIPPMWLALFAGLYFLNQNIEVVLLMSLLLALLLFPLTFGLVKGAWCLVKNTFAVILRPKLKRDMWENLTVEDHKFLSQYMTEDELVIFLKEVKSYNDLPIAEMNKLRIKNRETVEDIRKDTMQKELECKKEEKVKAYASTFYGNLK